MMTLDESRSALELASAAEVRARAAMIRARDELADAELRHAAGHLDPAELRTFRDTLEVTDNVLRIAVDRLDVATSTHRANELAEAQLACVETRHLEAQRADAEHIAKLEKSLADTFAGMLEREATFDAALDRVRRLGGTPAALGARDRATGLVREAVRCRRVADRDTRPTPDLAPERSPL